MPKQKQNSPESHFSPLEVVHQLQEKKTIDSETSYYLEHFFEKHLSSDVSAEELQKVFHRLFEKIIQNPNHAEKLVDFMLSKNINYVDQLLAKSEDQISDPENREMAFYADDISEKETGVNLYDITIGLREKMRNTFEKEDMAEILHELYSTKEESWEEKLQNSEWFKGLSKDSRKIFKGMEKGVLKKMCKNTTKLLKHDDIGLNIKSLTDLKDHYRMRVGDIRVVFKALGNGIRELLYIAYRGKSYTIAHSH